VTSFGNYLYDYHGNGVLASARGEEKCTPPRPRLQDAIPLPSPLRESVAHLAATATAFVVCRPERAPLVAHDLSPADLWRARFALASESTTLVCRLF
jgi:hypothetical protein